MTPREERKMATKVLRLNLGPEYDPGTERLLKQKPPTTEKKPTAYYERKLMLPPLQEGKSRENSKVERRLALGVD